MDQPNSISLDKPPLKKLTLRQSPMMGTPETALLAYGNMRPSEGRAFEKLTLRQSPMMGTPETALLLAYGNMRPSGGRAFELILQ